MHPTSSIGELTLAVCASVACQSLLLTSYLSFVFLSPMIVLIDVSLSHHFCRRYVTADAMGMAKEGDRPRLVSLVPEARLGTLRCTQVQGSP